jgi:hypothetical protein
MQADDCSSRGRDEKCVLIGKHEGEIPFGRSRRRWDLKKEGVSVGWICLAQDEDQWRVIVNTIMNHGVT